MATRNVVLPDPLEQDINELVETGRYQNRSEVIRAGLRLLLQQEAQNSAKLEALRNATSSGLMQLMALFALHTPKKPDCAPAP